MLNNACIAILLQNFHYMIQAIEHSITNDLYLDLHEGNYWCRAREAPHIRARAFRTRYIVRQPNAPVFGEVELGPDRPRSSSTLLAQVDPRASWRRGSAKGSTVTLTDPARSSVRTSRIP